MRTRDGGEAKCRSNVRRRLYEGAAVTNALYLGMVVAKKQSRMC